MHINNNFILKDIGASNTQNDSNIGRHSWYYYKEGFSPNLVKHAIDHVGIKDKDMILDPFNGSGTVTLSSLQSNVMSMGIEVNPFSSFIANTKQVTIKDVERLAENIDATKNAIHKGGHISPLLDFSTFSKTTGKEKWLFNKSVLNSFYSAFCHTSYYKNKATRDFIRLALISSAMDNCNAIRDGKCLKYRPNWVQLKYNKDSFLHSFETRIKNYYEDLILEPLPFKTKSIIINEDCRSFLNKTQHKFKLCITSPPYLNSFDYTDVYRPELFLGQFINTQSELLQLRKKTLRSHVNVRQSSLLNTDFGLLYTDTLNKIKAGNSSPWQKKIPVMIQAYFEDMSLIINKLKSLSVSNGELWLVVSNSAYNDIEIPVDLILAHIATTAGWFLSEIGVLRYITKRGTKYSPDITHLRESVIILKKKMGK